MSTNLRAPGRRGRIPSTGVPGAPYPAAMILLVSAAGVALITWR